MMQQNMFTTYVFHYLTPTQIRYEVGVNILIHMYKCRGTSILCVFLSTSKFVELRIIVKHNARFYSLFSIYTSAFILNLVSFLVCGIVPIH